MKKIFTLFAFVLLAVSMQARPFVEEGKTWFMEERSPQASLYPEEGIPSKFYTLKMEATASSEAQNGNECSPTTIPPMEVLH